MRYFCLIFLLLQCSLSLGQTTYNAEDFRISLYTDDDGLPQNSVTAIMSDKLGFVWLTTEGGLVRFNGNDFTVFNKQNTKDISSNRFNSFVRGPEQSIYAVSDQDDYVQISLGTAISAGGKKNRIGSKHKITQSLDSLFSIYSKQEVIWSKGGLPRVSYPNDGRLGFNYLIPTIGFDFFLISHDSISFFKKNNVAKTIKCPINNLFDCFSADGYLYYLEKGSIKRITPDSTNTVQLRGDLLKHPDYTKDKEQIVVFWNQMAGSVLLYLDSCFYHVEKRNVDTWQTTLIATGFSIDNKSIVSHYYDPVNKRLFLGSSYKGLYVIEPRRFKNLVEKSGDGNNVFYAHVALDSYSVLTAQGIEIGLGKNKRSYSILRNKDLHDRYSLLRDAKGHFWVKMFRSLMQLDEQFGIVKKWDFQKDISTIYESQDSIIWIGSRDNGGVYCKPITDNEPPLFCWPIKNVTFISSFSKKELWIGTSHGLYYVDRITNKVKAIDAFEGKNIQSILQLSEKEIWITTYEDGIFLILDTQVSAMPLDRNGYLATAHCIVRDKNDFFWVSTNKGLFQVARNDMLAYASLKQDYVYYYYYGKSNGFGSNEFNGGCQPCGITLKSGLISMPSLVGLVWFDPLKIKAELPKQPIIIERVTIDDQPITHWDSLLVPRRFGQLKIEVNTVFFGDRQNVQMSYCLEEKGKYNKKWFVVPQNRIIQFSALPYGKYILHIRKVNGFGTNNVSNISLKFKVPRAFYETQVFKILLVLFLVLFIYGYIKYRFYKIRRGTISLERKIEQRTQKLLRTLRELEVSEATLKYQTRLYEMLIASISHDIKSPMRYLLLSAKRMQELLVKKDVDKVMVFSEGIQETANKVYFLLDNLLKYMSIKIKQQEGLLEMLQLHDLVQNKVDTFKFIAEANGTQLRNGVAKDTLVWSNEDLLSIIVHNLIDNATKFTANGLIDIYVKGEGRSFCLVVVDTGTGISAEYASWLNDKSHEQIDIASAIGHKGMGLIIVKEIVAMLHGSISAASIESGGTMISISFEQ